MLKYIKKIGKAIVEQTREDWNIQKKPKATAAEKLIKMNPQFKANKANLKMVTPLPEHFVNKGMNGVPETHFVVVLANPNIRQKPSPKAQTPSIEYISLADFQRLSLSERLQKTAELLTYLRTIPNIPTNLLVKSDGSNIDYLTGADLQKILYDINRNLGPSKAARTAPRVPAEVCIHWISILNNALLTPTMYYTQEQESLIKKLMNAQKSRWMRHDLTIPAMKASLINDSEALLNKGLDDLSDIAYSHMGQGSLYEQLPVSDTYLPIATRLSDNIYGEAFDSFWINNLVEKSQSKSLFKTMGGIGLGLSNFLKELNTTALREIFMQELIEKLKHSAPRPWHQQIPTLQYLKNSSDMGEAWRALHTILKTSVKNNYQVILIAYLTSKSYISYQATVNKPKWMTDTNNNTAKNINIYRVRNATNTIIPINSPPPRSGIAFPSHPTTGDLIGNITSRPSTGRRALFPGEQSPNNSNLDRFGGLDPDTGKISKLMFEHGIPYTGGLSGTANMIMGAIMEFYQTDKTINLLEAVVATIMFVVYDGGHNVHEALWALHQRELQGNPYSIGLRLVPLGKPMPSKDLFIADYRQFIDLYQNLPQTKLALDQSCQDAWIRTLEYFKQHSHYANQFVKERLI